MEKIKNYLSEDVRMLESFENAKYEVAFWVKKTESGVNIHGTSYIHKILDTDAHHDFYLSYELAKKRFTDIVLILSK